MTLADLATESGIPARTIRFYIARGLLSGPVKAGRGAAYTAQHLARLGEIQKLQSAGRTLSEIIHLLSAGPAPAPASLPTACWQHVVDDDVMVLVRGDVSPWRMKQIRAAIDNLAEQLAASQNSEK